MIWHLIEGEEGCAYAVEHRCVAVVVDALRASATAAMLVDAGAIDLLVVREIKDAFAVRAAAGDALLFGERGGLPPTGFDYGNSPRTVSAAAGRHVIFTTTTGAGRLISAWGPESRRPAGLFMGTTLNATAVARHAKKSATESATDVVLIPAGLAGDPSFDAQEDWVAATVIAMKAAAVPGTGAERFHYWRGRIEREGVPALFAASPHAAKLRRVGLESDIAYSAQVDITTAVPKAVERSEHGVLVRKA